VRRADDRLSWVAGGDDRDRIRGALLGLAVGHALGAPLEGMAPDATAAVVARGLDMTGGGWWAPGEWTDDTAMALALAESIATHGLLDTDDLVSRALSSNHKYGTIGHGKNWSSQRGSGVDS
jgi:ADP-ribosylglycohydrolase